MPPSALRERVSNPFFREYARRINFLYVLNDMGEIGKFISQIELELINCCKIYNHI